MYSLDFGLIASSFQSLLDPFTITMLFLGVLGGLVVGVMPGLGPTLAVALLIPLTYHLTPGEAFSILTAVYVGGMSGGAVSAILLRLPGTPASMATLLDGFPLAQQGQAARAIGNAAVASCVGTCIGGIFLVIGAPLLAEFALKFHFAEYTAVCIFAMTAVSAVTGRSVNKGLTAAMLGMLLATVGITSEDGLPRFTFGMEALESGFPLLPALIGLFAVSQLMKLKTNQPPSPEPVSVEEAKDKTKFLPSFKDIFANKLNYARSGVIGTVVGVMPALGGGPAAMIAYAQARAASKAPTKFGKGSVEGLIASETANNATIGGGLIIALTLGIPGDPTSAVLLGGLMLHGLEPGPFLFLNNADVLYAIYFALFVSSLLMVLILMTGGRLLVKIVDVPKYVLNPVVLLMCVFGVYSLNYSTTSILIMGSFGILGYVLDKLNYPLPPLVLGLIIGPLLEGNLRKMISTEHSLMPLFTNPIALGFIVLSVISLIYAQRLRSKVSG